MSLKLRAAWLYNRFERLFRYGAVGVAVSIVNTLLTVMFYKTGLIGSPVAAISVSTVITMPVSFLWHRRVTYTDAVRDDRQWVRFFLLSMSSLAFGAASMKLAVFMVWPYWAGLLVAWFVIPTANFLVNALYVFRVSDLFVVKEKSPPTAAKTEHRQG